MIEYLQDLLYFILAKILYIFTTLSLPVFPPILPIILYFYLRKEGKKPLFLLRLLPFAIGTIPALVALLIWQTMLILSNYTSYTMNTFFKGTLVPLGLYTIIALALETWIILTMRSISKKHLPGNKKVKIFMLVNNIYCVTSILGSLTITAQTFGFEAVNNFELIALVSITITIVLVIRAIRKERSEQSAIKKQSV